MRLIPRILPAEVRLIPRIPLAGVRLIPRIPLAGVRLIPRIPLAGMRLIPQALTQLAQLPRLGPQVQMKLSVRCRDRQAGAVSGISG